MTDEDFSKSKSRNWVLTLHLDGWDEEKLVKQIRDYPDWVRYIRFGREICPTTGSVHFQAWCMTWEPVRFSQFKSWIGNRYRAPMYGNIEQNEAYTSKDGLYEDLGTKPMQGRRTDLIGTKRRLDQIQSGENVYDIAREEPHFGAITKHSRFFKEYVANNRMRAVQNDFSKPEVIYIYGPPRTGKDKYVDEHYPGVYDCPNPSGYKWKDGYNMEPCVVYRNITPDAIKPNKCQFLKEIDRRFLQVEVKGGFVPWKPKTIVMTSIFDPWQMAAIFDDPQEFLGRVTKYLAYHNADKSFHEMRI